MLDVILIVKGGVWEGVEISKHCPGKSPEGLKREELGEKPVNIGRKIYDKAIFETPCRLAI